MFSTNAAVRELISTDFHLMQLYLEITLILSTTLSRAKATDKKVEWWWLKDEGKRKTLAGFVADIVCRYISNFSALCDQT